MSKPRATNTGSPAPDVARLLRDLATRERQLRDLTEQSLGFLEELAESRRLEGEREQLVARLSDLERNLADAKNRLRHAGGAAPSSAAAPVATGKGARGKTRPALEVVFWGTGSRDAARSAGRTTGVSVSWVGLPDAVGADDAAPAVASVTHRDARTPAQCWNLGMASTTADAVLFVGPGVQIASAPKLPDGLPANAALLCPRIERGTKVEIGNDQIDDLLRLRPRPGGDDREPFFRVQWADASAFVVRRAAFDRIGTFDESLLGPAALLEFGLRARSANFDVLGVPGVTVTANETDDAPESDVETTGTDRERLVVVAMHRPEQLGHALADTSVLWDLPLPEVPGFLAQMLARLPTVDGLPHQRAVVERIASGLVRHALPGHHTASQVRRARLSLLNRFADAGTVASRDEFTAAAQGAEAQRLGDPAAELDALVREVAMCAEAAASTARTLDRTRDEMRELDAERHLQSDRAERAEGARQQAQQQLDQVQQWLRETQNELRVTQEARAHALMKIEEVHRGAALVAQELAESKQQRTDLEARLAEAQRDRDAVAEEGRSARERLEAAERRHRDFDRDREASIARNAELERAHAAVQQQHRELEREYLTTDADSRTLREQLMGVKSLLGLVTDASSDDMQTRLRLVHEQAQRLAGVLHSSGAADAEDLVNRVDDLSQRLASAEMLVRDRERWIALLLQEVAQRRLFSRPLQDHERALVERVGRTP